MRVRRSLLSLTLVAAVLGMAGGCASQGEGQRCDRNNNDADCDTASGFVCTPVSSLGGLNAPQGSAICCPSNHNLATVDACRGGQSGFEADAATIGPAPGAAKLDAGNDAKPDGR